MPHVDATCTTHHACECIQAQLAALRKRCEAGERFHSAAWEIIRHEYGEHFRVPDSDTSPWANKMRKFCAAWDAYDATRGAGKGEG